MGAFSEIWQLFTGATAQPRGVCMLPLPVAKREKGIPQKKEPGIYVISEERRQFGFRSDKEASREGAVKWLTNFDQSELEARNLGGKTKEVQAQNKTCKERWALGESVAQCAALMKLSDSWVEKRYACFSAALLIERG